VIADQARIAKGLLDQVAGQQAAINGLKRDKRGTNESRKRTKQKNKQTRRMSICFQLNRTTHSLVLHILNVFCFVLFCFVLFCFFFGGGGNASE